MARQSQIELYAAIRPRSAGGSDDPGGDAQARRLAPDGASGAGLGVAEAAQEDGAAGERLDPYKPVIDTMLRADLNALRKQRHTAKRIFDRLDDEHDAPVPYGIVRGYVAERRPHIRVALLSAAARQAHGLASVFPTPSE